MVDPKASTNTMVNKIPMITLGECEGCTKEVVAGVWGRRSLGRREEVSFALSPLLSGSNGVAIARPCLVLGPEVPIAQVGIVIHGLKCKEGLCQMSRSKVGYKSLIEKQQSLRDGP